MPQQETLNFVIYDISDDRARRRVSEACHDFGLSRFQYSAFQGLLTRNRREELALLLTRLLDKHGGRVTLVPICQADHRSRIDLEITAEQAAENSVPPLTLFRPTPD